MSRWGAQAERVRWASLCVMLLVIGIRVLCDHARIPWWDFDPLVSPLDETRITPAMGLVMDAAMVLSAAGVVLAEALAGRRVGFFWGVLALLGMVGVGLHGLVLRPYGGAPSLHGDARALTIGATWAGAIAGGYAIALLGRDPRMRRAAAGVLLGIAIPLAAIGIVQVFIEHANTVRTFDADPAGALSAAGLSPGSPGAAAFERRLRQAEAMGSFGLANVYGTVVAAGAVFFGVIAWGALRRRAMGALGIALVGAGSGAVGLWLSGSKGAAAAAVFAIGFVIVARFLTRRLRAHRRLGIALGIGLIAIPLAAVVARGIVGERIGELSLLFRWHYAQAAGRIIAQHPVFGVGPGNFKAAYALAKNPINPEQVESPHSVILDWMSTLGVFGAAWGALLIAGAAGVGVRACAREEDADPVGQIEPSARKPGELLAIVVPLLCGAAAMWIARGAIGHERAIALGAGLGGWVLAAWWCARSRAFDGWIGLAAAAAGAVVIAQGQIEVTPVMAGSAPWWAAVIGLGVAMPGGRGRRAGGVLLAGALAAWGAILGAQAPRLFAWEGGLHEAWVDVARSPSGKPIDGAAPAGRRLAQAWNAEPGFLDVGMSAVRSLLVSGQRGDGADARSVTRALTDFFPGRAEAWVARANAADDSSERLEALERSIALDPWSLSLAVRRADLGVETLDPKGAAGWARRALDIDDHLRLDPVVRLSPADRARLERMVREGTPPKTRPGGPHPPNP